MATAILLFVINYSTTYTDIMKQHFSLYQIATRRKLFAKLLLVVLIGTLGLFVYTRHYINNLPSAQTPLLIVRTFDPLTAVSTTLNESWWFGEVRIQSPLFPFSHTKIECYWLDHSGALKTGKIPDQKHDTYRCTVIDTVWKVVWIREGWEVRSYYGPYRL